MFRKNKKHIPNGGVMVMNPMVESKTQENEQIDLDTSDSDPCGGNGIIAPFR